MHGIWPFLRLFFPVYRKKSCNIEKNNNPPPFSHRMQKLQNIQPTIFATVLNTYHICWNASQFLFMVIFFCLLTQRAFVQRNCFLFFRDPFFWHLNFQFVNLDNEKCRKMVYVENWKNLIDHTDYKRRDTF